MLHKNHPTSDARNHADICVGVGTSQRAVEPAKEAREGLQAATLASGPMRAVLPDVAPPPAAAPLQLILRIDHAAVVLPINSKYAAFMQHHSAVLGMLLALVELYPDCLCQPCRLSRLLHSISVVPCL